MILITRPKDQSKELIKELNSKGIKTIKESLYSIRYYNKKISYDKNLYYIFTSIHAVESLIKNKEIYKLKNAKILAIGQKVKDALKIAGCKKILVNSEDSNSLIKILNKSKYIKCSFIYFCSNVVNEDFFKKLKVNKIDINRQIIYQTIPRKCFTKSLINNLKSGKIKAATFYSYLAAQTFISLLSNYRMNLLIKDTQIFCLSKRIAVPFRKKKFAQIYVSPKPNQPSLIVLITKKIIL
tara:strand:- start:3931 stop:4647 length:717 start_codon:yes stop_codon:yes gene_type:complete